MKRLLFFLTFSFFITHLFIDQSVASETAVEEFPKIVLDGRPANVTIQDLSGLVSRPLRMLVNRNNKLHGENFLQVFAVGVKAGMNLRAELSADVPGTRITVYRIFRHFDGTRYLSMPLSRYYAQPKKDYYEEHLELFREQYLIFVFEKVESEDEKNIQIRYFEEHVRKLVIASYKTNITLSQLKLKMKDFGLDQTKQFFERDAQLLIDRLNHPQKIFLVRLWKVN